MENLSVNQYGHLAMGGIDVTKLAEKYGTPLYLMDEDVMRKNCREYQNSLKECFGGESTAAFASKALCASFIYPILKDEGMYADVVSGGEIYTALHAGFPAERLIFHGNNKTEDELNLALSSGVGRIVVDNAEELSILNRLAKENRKICSIMFRIKPGIDAHTHNAIKTGCIDSKFGVALETGEAFEIVKTALSLDNVKLAGVHCHIGSQIFDTEPFLLAVERMTEFMAKVKNELGYEIPELNLGGGIGITYVDGDDPKPIREYIQNAANQLDICCSKYGINKPRVFVEPGRSIVGPAGITVYKVGAVKTIPNIRTYVSIDGGMTDNPRYALYESKYEIINASKAGAKKDMVCTLAGRCCESGDLIGKDLEVQTLSSGDYVAVLATGAYNYSMASNYNRVPRPPIVAVKSGEDRLVVRRETYEDIVRLDIV